MLLYPQLQSGAIVQFPLRRTYTVTTVTNLQEDGSRYRSTDIDPPRQFWRLSYSQLSQLEASAIQSVFKESRGRLHTFVFLDPVGNLLSWSEDLEQPVWEKSPQQGISPIETTLGTAYRISAGRLSQSLDCPALAQLCFSLYARADGAGTITLAISDTSGGTSKTFVVGPGWRRCFVSHKGIGNGEEKIIDVAVNAGAPQIAQLMVCPQPSPSNYTATERFGGIHPATRFDQDSLVFRAEAEDTFGLDVVLVSEASPQ